MKNVSAYFGFGRSLSSTTFYGGSAGLCDDANSHQVSLSQGHQLIGFNAKYQEYFANIEFDRYQETVYSGKLGMRF